MKEVVCYISSVDQSIRLRQLQPLLPSGDDAAKSDAGPSVWIQPERTFQTIEGFGGAFTESAATVWQSLPADVQTVVLRSYFAEEGNQYSFCRVHMNSCDFSLGNYSHLERPGDMELQSYSIDRDCQALIPFIKAAQAMATRPLRLLASPWSPPYWMKSNGRMNGGGKLLKEYAQVWAQCYVRFIKAYSEQGIAIWGVTVQNEPEATQRWDSCLYTAEEERDFVRYALGPALEQAGLGHIAIVIWDHNRDRMVERTGVVYADPEAARYVWGAGIHWYGEEHFDHVRLVHDAWPDKKVLFTEGCQEGGPHRGGWKLAERYARNIINDLNRWTVGWIDWNLLLDHQGGPNHVGNYCSAPILADPNNQNVEWQSSYYAIGHFSRFIAVGAKRILCAATLESLECSAFINPDGRIICVVLNRADSDIEFTLRLHARLSVKARLPAHAIATYCL